MGNSNSNNSNRNHDQQTCKTNIKKCVEYGKNSKNTSSVEFNDCPICLKLTDANHMYVISACNHIFHKSCYEKQWTNNKKVKEIEKNNSCPVCLLRITQCREYLSPSYPIIQYMTNFHIQNIMDSYYITLNDNNKGYIRQYYKKQLESVFDKDGMFIFEDINTHDNIRKYQKYNNFYVGYIGGMGGICGIGTR